MDDATALERLRQVDHIVVLMMENRSFDHMLGYLSLPEGEPCFGGGRGDVDGLSDSGRDSERFEGKRYVAEPIGDRGLTKIQDPGHLGWQVGQQMAHGMKGFVANYATSRAYQDPGDVLRYQTARNVPVYDWMARRFVVLDRWFCSVPGATWPNRLSALTGHAQDKDNKFPPLYDHRSFVHNLAEGTTWRWYSSDPGSLRIADSAFRIGHEDHFAFAEKPSLLQKRTFYTDVMAGDLPNVSWIDPNFVDLGGLGGANDDHPPTDVMAGQSFILKIYNALSQSHCWHRSMLVITYDEHGGFYDHVDPRAIEDETFAERAEFGHFGPRVPALVISPFVDPGVVFGSPQEGEPHARRFLFDHTSLIKTILLRFGDGNFDGLPPRVASAAHLGHVLGANPPRPPEEVSDDALGYVANWWAKHMSTHLSYPTATVPALAELGVPDKQAGGQAAALNVLSLVGRLLDWAVRRVRGDKQSAGPRPPLRLRRPPSISASLPEADEFQRGVLAAAKEIRGQGLPSGQP